MSVTEDESRESDGSFSAIESVGVACARASIVALVLGMLEGTLLGRHASATSAGIGLATAGLYLPAALASLLPGSFLVRWASDSRKRQRLALSLGAALLFGLLTHLAAPVSDPGRGWPLRVLPLELASLLSLGTVVSLMRFEPPLRRPAAFVGLTLVVLVQAYANRWIDAHRALAGALAEGSFFPRTMLRLVLRRFS